MIGLNIRGSGRRNMGAVLKAGRSFQRWSELCTTCGRTYIHCLSRQTNAPNRTIMAPKVAETSAPAKPLSRRERRHGTKQRPVAEPTIQIPKVGVFITRCCALCALQPQAVVVRLACSHRLPIIASCRMISSGIVAEYSTLCVLQSVFKLRRLLIHLRLFRRTMGMFCFCGREHRKQHTCGQFTRHYPSWDSSGSVERVTLLTVDF